MIGHLSLAVDADGDQEWVMSSLEQVEKLTGENKYNCDVSLRFLSLLFYSLLIHYWHTVGLEGIYILSLVALLADLFVFLARFAWRSAKLRYLTIFWRHPSSWCCSWSSSVTRRTSHARSLARFIPTCQRSCAIVTALESLLLQTAAYCWASISESYWCCFWAAIVFFPFFYWISL